jgi:tRNA A37 methylthiotransferase MiaB
VLAEASIPGTLIPGKVRCRELDWFKEAEPLELLFKAGERAIFDLIIVTDCSLTERDTEGVFAMIEKYSTKGHTRVVVAACLEREGTPLADRKAKTYEGYKQVENSQHHLDYSSSRFQITTFDA